MRWKKASSSSRAASTSSWLSNSVSIMMHQPISARPNTLAALRLRVKISASCCSLSSHCAISNWHSSSGGGYRPLWANSSRHSASTTAGKSVSAMVFAGTASAKSTAAILTAKSHSPKIWSSIIKAMCCACSRCSSANGTVNANTKSMRKSAVLGNTRTSAAFNSSPFIRKPNRSTDSRGKRCLNALTA